MDLGQQRMQQQETARQMMYQNPGYQFERRDKKTLILDVSDVNGSDFLACPLGNGIDFSVELFEPLIIDKHSDIYLDSFLTHNSLICHTGDKMAFSLQINEFNVNSNVASSLGGQHIFNRIIIPNEHNSVEDIFSAFIHKGKKLNYVCSINPSKLTKITGKITDLGGNSIYSTALDKRKTETRLHYIKLEPTGVTKSVPAGTRFGFSAGTTPAGSIIGFRTAFDMDINSVDLYFYIDNDMAVDDAALLGDVQSEVDVGLGTADRTGPAPPLPITAFTYKKGDEGRFIAEFVIVARD
jgi:hypothetical protein